MELQFNKTLVPSLKSVVREIQTQEQTQEVRLTDGMPDIGKILSCWAQIVIRGKEWRTGGMSVSGGVMAWVLYAPEGEDEPQCLETWLPFQMKWDLPDTEHDGEICIIPLIRGIDARSISARKLMVRVGIAIMGEAMLCEDAELYTPCELPEDVQILKKDYPMLIPREAGEKAFVVEDTVAIPTSMQALKKIMYYGVTPVVTDQKVVGDKIVFHGKLNLHLMYMGIDGRLYCWDTEIPFSQFHDLRNSYDNDAVSRICFAVTSLELEQGEEENLSLKAGITGQYVIYEHAMISLVEDAYSPVRNIRLRSEMLHIPSVLDMQTITLQPEMSIEFRGTDVVDTAFYPEHPRIYTDADQVTTEINGTFQLLGYEDNERLQAQTGRWEDTWSTIASGRVAASLQPTGTAQASVSANGAMVHSELPMSVITMLGENMPMVTGMELDETTQPDPNRPSIVMRRMGENSLWEIAKATGSTVDAIQKVNPSVQEGESNRMLLIPIQ